MNYRNSTVSLFALMSLLFVFLLLAVACEPFLVLKFENQTDQVLTIYVNSHRIVDIKPGETIERPTVPLVVSRYLVEAKNDKGEVLYSKIYTTLDISKAKYKIVIQLFSE